MHEQAERELSAFIIAVTDLFGPKQAEESAEDWLRELVACTDLPASAGEWRTLTIAAATRLANRVTASTLVQLPRTWLGGCEPIQ
jgi:hypothetical protein